MGLHLERGDPHKLRGRATLTLPNPLIENALQAANFDDETLHQATLWGNAMLRARDAWADENRKRRRYSDEPADRHQNRLNWQNRGRA